MRRWLKQRDFGVQGSGPAPLRRSSSSSSPASASSCGGSRSCRSRSSGFGFWLDDVWDPVSGEFGARPFIWGTLYSSVLALALATPISLGIAIFLSELCPARLRQPLDVPHRAAGGDSVDRLRAVGHLRAGAGGPRLRGVAAGRACAQLPFFSGPPVGVGMLSAVLILAIMVIPFTSSVAREVLKAVPMLAARGGLRARRDAVGGHPGGAVLRPHRHHRRDHARLRPRAGRDDGGDDGHRQQPADLAVAVRAAVHDGGGARQRVHRGGRRALSRTRSSRSAWCCSRSRSSSTPPRGC